MESQSKLQSSLRTTPLARYATSGGLNEIPNDSKPQPCAILMGAIERFKDPFKKVRWNPGPRVLHGKDHQLCIGTQIQSNATPLRH